MQPKNKHMLNNNETIKLKLKLQLVKEASQLHKWEGVNSNTTSLFTKHLGDMVRQVTPHPRNPERYLWRWYTRMEHSTRRCDTVKGTTQSSQHEGSALSIINPWVNLVCPMQRRSRAVSNGWDMPLYSSSMLADIRDLVSFNSVSPVLPDKMNDSVNMSTAGMDGWVVSSALVQKLYLYLMNLCWLPPRF